MVNIQKSGNESDNIIVKDKYISKRLVWKKDACIQEYFAHKIPERREIQEKARIDFIERVSAGTFKFFSRSCVICSGKKFWKIADCDRMGLFFPMSICCYCGLVQANPVLRQSDYDDFYRGLYRNMFTARRKTSEALLRKKANTRGARLFSYLENSNILKNIDKKNDLIVEVGCGDGAILSYFHEKGYRIIGIDFDEEYMSSARQLGYDLRSASLREIAAEQKPKLVYYHHVLEHIVDVDSHLRELSDSLSDSGFCAIVVPGVKYIHKAYRRDLLQYLQIAHVFNFSLYTLEMLMAKYGFTLQSGDEGVRAIFKKEGRCSQIASGRSESLSILHYFKGLETEIQKTGSNRAIAG